jgi:4-phospho-D-threonate 3-dehydrogenase / 4-phospho-D-erythronate 3-dehydrogenase
MLPKIGITLGDPGGIGPEICLKAIIENLKKPTYIPVLIGSKSILEHPKLKALTSQLKLCTKLDTKPTNNTCYLIDIKTKNKDFVIGVPDKINGKLCFDFIIKGIDLAKKKDIAALVTAPICKESLKLAALPYTGHTTMLTKLTKSSEVSMGFYTPELKTVLVTVHKPLTKVAELLTEENLTAAAKNSFLFANILNIPKPKIALAALNPHAGEAGLFGIEEQNILEPFIDKIKKQGLNILGPIPADTLYHRALKKEFDIVISLYHDQALIPVKLLAFDRAVNITLGLPFIRTSPDHGTAFDIAYKNEANPGSMIEAIKLAVKAGVNNG